MTVSLLACYGAGSTENKAMRQRLSYSLSIGQRQADDTVEDGNRETASIIFQRRVHVEAHDG